MILFSELSKEGCLFELDSAPGSYNRLARLMTPETVYMTLAMKLDISWHSIRSMTLRCLNLNTGEIDILPVLVVQDFDKDVWKVDELTKAVEADKAAATH